jgi:hypothetical protein
VDVSSRDTRESGGEVDVSSRDTRESDLEGEQYPKIEHKTSPHLVYLTENCEECLSIIRQMQDEVEGTKKYEGLADEYGDKVQDMRYNYEQEKREKTEVYKSCKKQADAQNVS